MKFCILILLTCSVASAGLIQIAIEKLVSRADITYSEPVSRGLARTHTVMFQKAQDLIEITSAHSKITLMAGEDGRVYQIGYGQASATVSKPSRAPSRELEFYPPAGNGYLLEPAIQAQHDDGNTSLDLVLVRHETMQVDDNIQLPRIELKDGAMASTGVGRGVLYTRADYRDVFIEIDPKDNQLIIVK